MPLPADNSEAAAKVHELYLHRKQKMTSHFGVWNAVRQIYHNQVNLPLPELDKLEKPAIPNLVAQGIDQTAMRASSVMPDVTFPSERPGFVWADNRARDSRLATKGWWKMNRLQLLLPRRARHLVAYGVSPVSISPVSSNAKDDRRIPHWRVRNPMGTFPAETDDHTSIEPADCIFSDVRTYAWLMQNYPEQARAINTPDNPSSSDLYYVLEYVDEMETAVVVLGAKREGQQPGMFEQAKPYGAAQMLLSRIPNRSGICPVVYPKRIALDGIVGQFDSMLGMYESSAKLFALNLIAVTRDVFKDEWIVGSTPNMAPEVIQQADGREGVIGLVHNGNVVTTGQPPGALTMQMQDALERNQRLTGSIPAEMGGESPTNVRTARRGADVMGNAIDGVIAELQTVFSSSMEEETRRAIEIQKAYYGDRKCVFFGEKYDGKVSDHPDYMPNETFVRNDAEVKYAVPGTDLPGLIVEVGQLMGANVLSAHTAMEMVPLIADPEKEMDRIEVESLRRALLQSLEAGAQNGTVDPHQIALVAQRKFNSNTPIEDIVIEIQKEQQQAQAQAQQAQAQQPPEEGPAPEAQSGLGNPDSNGPSQVPTAIPPVSPNQVNAQSMLAGLRKASMIPEAERGMQ